MVRRRIRQDRLPPHALPQSVVAELLHGGNAGESAGESALAHCSSGHCAASLPRSSSLEIRIYLHCCCSDGKPRGLLGPRICKMPKVAGILIETTFGSIVEIILFVALIIKHNSNSSADNGNEGNLVPIIQAAILGSILTNLLLCLGLCFFFGGLRQSAQKFHAIVSEVGAGLLLVAAFRLLIPSAFYSALKSEAVVHANGEFTRPKLQDDVLHISRATSLALMLAAVLWAWFQASSQHSIFDEVIEMDEHRDADRETDLERPKFTMTETVISLVFPLALVTILLILLVEGIEHVVEAGVPDQFLGLILLPLVEKAAEHITAVDEAWGTFLLSADTISSFARKHLNSGNA